MHQAFYRKYRPQIFDDVCGQEHITSVLKYESEMGKVSHAYLFCGSRGTGKTTCAKILAKAVNCENPQNGNPCGKCGSCRSIDAGSATDVVEMDAASNNGVDDIRELRDAVVYTPSMLKKRVYIIDEVHMLTVNAFNALLKTLEEPPEYVIFILATTELHKLPATIISRCKRFDFRRITVKSICRRLQIIASSENITLEKEAAERIARIAEGGMRDAVNLFELCLRGGNSVDCAAVEDVLGMSGYETMKRAALAAASGDTATLIEMIAENQASSKDVSVLWQELVSFWRDMMIMKISDDAAKYLDLTEAEFSILEECAKAFNMNKLLYQSSVLDTAQQDMARSPQNKRTIAEFALLRITSPALEASTDALLSRIAELEDRVALLESGAVIPATPKPVAPKETAPIEEVPAPSAPERETPDETVSPAEPVKEDAPSDGFAPVPDVQALLEKLGTGMEMYKSFIADSLVEINGDGTVVRVTVSGGFELNMLSGDEAKNAIARAALLTKLTSVSPTVTVVQKEKAQNDGQTSLFEF